ncbi:MAG: hypothetical protein ACOC4C_01595 [Fibrobacterota bacterium]
MEKIYRYHTFLRKPDSYIIVAGIIFGLFIWMLPVAAHLMFYFPIGPLIRVTFFLSFTVVLLGIIALSFYREFRETAFILKEDTITRNSPNKTIIIPFASVTRFYFRNLGIFGYGVLSAGGEKIRFPFWIDELAELSSQLRSELLRHNRSSSFKASQIDRFIRHAKVSDLSARRTQEAIRPLVFMMCTMALLNVIIANRLWELPAFLAFGWAIISVCFPLGTYLVSDWWLSRVVSFRLNHDSQSFVPPDATGVYACTGLAGAILYLIAGILFKNVFWKILIYGM